MDMQGVSLNLEIWIMAEVSGCISFTVLVKCVILPAQIAMMMLILFQMFKEWPISTQWPVREFSAFLQGMFSLSSLIAGIVEVV